MIDRTCQWLRSLQVLVTTISIRLAQSLLRMGRSSLKGGTGCRVVWIILLALVLASLALR